MKIRLIIIGLALLALVSTVGAQATVPPFAAVEGDTLTLVDADGASRPLLTNDNGFTYLAWNAAGTQLAYLQRGPQWENTLGVVEAATGQVTQLETASITPGFNLSWMADGRILFAANNFEMPVPEGQGVNIDLFAIEPQAGAEAQRLGTVVFGTGCGGGSPLPADWIYWRETGGFGGYFLTLAETPYGIVYSLNCMGTSLGLLDPATGESVELSTNFAKAVVSPDGEQVAGIEASMTDRSVQRVLLLTLATREITELAFSASPDLLTWSADGSRLYYSVRELSANLVSDLSRNDQIALNEKLGYEVTDLPAYTSALRQFDLSSGADAELFSGSSYAIGRIAEGAGAVYFSLIPNLNAWLDAVLRGESVYDDPAGMRYVLPEVMRLATAESPDASYLGQFEQFTPVGS